MRKIYKILIELLIVFLGLWAALLINNWNEDRKEKIEVNRITLTIKSDIENEILQLEERIETDSLVIKELLFILDSIENGKIIRDLSGHLYHSSSHQKNNTGFNILQNSQHIDKIDYELYTELAVHYNTDYELFDYVMKLDYDYLMFIYLPRLEKFYNKRNKVLEISSFELIEFNNVLRGRISLLKQRNEISKYFLETARELKVKIH